MAMPMASAWTPFRPRLGVRRVRAADPKAASAGAAPRADRGIGATMRRISAWSVFRGSLRHRAGPRLAPSAVRSAAAAFQPERRAIGETRRSRVALGNLSGTPLRGSHSASSPGADKSWVPAAAGARGFDARAFFAFDVDDATGDETTARGDPVDPALALPRVPVTLSGDTAWAYWVCAAVAAALFAVPMGFARWGLSTIAPLVWWQVAASTAAGTLMASPYLLALANPAVSYRLSFPALARVAFGVQGARLVIALRAVLGLALTALTALAGGAATYRLWGEVSYVFFDGAPLPSWAPAAAYALFWLAQLAFASGKSQAKKVRALGRLAAVTAAAYAAWSWNAGDAATVWTATARAVQSVSAGAGGGLAGAGAALAPALEPEFWRHALMVCGTWMTLGTVVPDYAQRMTTPKSVTLGVLVGLPAFAAAAALVGSSLAQAPNLALYSALLVACLVTNAATNVVGPMTWVKQGAGRRLSSGAAATIVTSIAAVAAYAVLPWQTVVAYASWAVGAGALFVAPAAGVVVADYWVCRDRVVDRDALQTAAATGAYAYAGGTNFRAVAALFAGMVPELWSFASNIAADLAARNAGALTLQSVMDSVRALLGWFVFNSEYSAVIAAATAFVAYVSLTVMFVPESLKVARAEAAALSADERAARERARVAAAEAAANAAEMAKHADGVAAAAANDARRGAAVPFAESSFDEDIVSREEFREETEEEIVVTTVTRQRRRRGNEYIETGIKSARQTTAPDVDNIDLNAVRRFYLDTAERIKQALAPARAAKPTKEAAIQRWRQEESAMLESHVARSGSQSMREVRYEIMRVKELIAEAELGAAVVDDELAEAWLFFEEEAAEDSASLEARLLPQRDKRLRGEDKELAREVYALIDERRARAADAAQAVPRGGREGGGVLGGARRGQSRALRRGRAPRRGRVSGAAAQLGARRRHVARAARDGRAHAPHVGG